MKYALILLLGCVLAAPAAAQTPPSGNPPIPPAVPDDDVAKAWRLCQALFSLPRGKFSEPNCFHVRDQIMQRGPIVPRPPAPKQLDIDDARQFIQQQH